MLIDYVIGFILGLALSYFVFRLWMKLKYKELIEKSRKIKEKINYGLIAEKLYPLITNKIEDIEDLRFIGSPIDYIEFNGLSENKPVTIKFIEIKTGNSKLTEREERIKEAVENKRVEWNEIKIDR